MKIRGHHILCMQGFQGKGYDKNFIANMSRLTREITLKPGAMLKVTDECDDICASCPYISNNACARTSVSSRETKCMDLKVFRKLGIKKGAAYKAAALFDLVNEKIKTVSEAEKICGKCEWQAECLWFADRKKKYYKNSKTAYTGER
ncbi:MAG: DUF1284 domain-containing protein [Elusimicrobia bacterium]|nr:DUF1284 domain-containing protein [Elusimicrobiota bacterium]